MKKLFFLLCILLLCFPLTSSLTDLGYFQSDNSVRISQVCSGATYINISSITFPNSSTAIENVEMNYLGNGEFYYDFNETSLLGRYDVRGVSDGCTQTFATYFQVTTNGKAPAEGIVIVLFSILFIAFMFFGLIYFIKSFGYAVEFNMDLLDTTIMISFYLGTWVFYYLSREYLGNAVINNLLETFISVGAVTHVFLPLVGFMVSFIMTNLKFKQKARVTY